MVAARAAVQAWNAKNLLPIEDLGMWDTYEARLFRYYFYDLYYNNSAYSSIAAWVARMKFEKKLYKNIRSIYNPVQRLVDMYPAKIYGGALDLEKLTSGAIPIVGAGVALTNAIRQLWQWSNWGVNKSLFVRNGARYGDKVLKVVDESDKEKVRLEVLHPGKIKEVTRDAVGNVKAVTIEYQREEPSPPAPFGQPPRKPTRTYVYTEKIDQERFQFFKNGTPWDYINGVEKGEFAEYENPYGFVPLVIGQHKDLGLQWGANAFHGQAEKIDELNDSASLLNDQERNTVKAFWYLAGVKSTKEITAESAQVDEDGNSRRDVIDAIYGPAGSQPFPMVAPLNIEGALNNLQKMLDELERDMPELALHRLREQGQATAPGVRAVFSDASDRITEAAGNYNDTLVRAQQMAVSIGGFRRYRNFEPFDLESFDRGELEHTIKTRPMIEDQLSLKEEMDVLRDNGAPIWVVLEKLNYSKEVIDRVVNDKAEAERNAVRGAMQGIFGDQTGDEEDEDEPTPVTQPEMALAGA